MYFLFAAASGTASRVLGILVPALQNPRLPPTYLLWRLVCLKTEALKSSENPPFPWRRKTFLRKSNPQVSQATGPGSETRGNRTS